MADRDTMQVSNRVYLNRKDTVKGLPRGCKDMSLESQLREKSFVLDYDSRGTQSTMARKVWQQAWWQELEAVKLQGLCPVTHFH